MKTPRELIEEAEKSKEGLEDDGLYPHQIGEDVSGEIIIAEINTVIEAYKSMRMSCLEKILKLINKEPDEDEESIIKFKERIIRKLILSI